MAVSTARLTDGFQNGLGQWPEGQRFCLGFSAGNDSLALFILAHRLLGHGQLRAVHVHHGLSEQADHWSSTARQIAERLGRPLRELRVNVVAGVNGPEGDARQARYSAFARELAPGEVLLLAHHRDDQIETVMMRLLSGAGLHGLMGMPAIRPLGPGYLWRPLLEQPAAALQQVVREAGYFGVSDPSNADVRLQRGYFRRELMPRLRERFPGFETAMQRSVRHLRQAGRLIDDLCEQRVAEAADGDFSVDLAALAAEGQDLLVASLRFWLRSKQVDLPSTRRLESFIQQLDAAASRSPQMCWGGYQLRRYRQRLYLLPRELPEALPEDWSVDWCLAQSLSLPGERGVLRVIGSGALEGRWLKVRARQAGDRIRLPGKQGSRSLKNLFQEAGVPPWQRVGTPVLCHPRNQRVLAVGDCWISPAFQRWLAQRGWQLQWQRELHPTPVA
jgi:tRNA(Ile)-lysidine synthase